MRSTLTTLTEPLRATVDVDGWLSGIVCIQITPDLDEFSALVENFPQLARPEAMFSYRRAMTCARSFHSVQRCGWLIVVWSDRTDSIVRSLVQEVYHVTDSLWRDANGIFGAEDMSDRALLTSIMFDIACQRLDDQWAAQQSPFALAG